MAGVSFRAVNRLAWSPARLSLHQASMEWYPGARSEVHSGTDRGAAEEFWFLRMTNQLKTRFDLKECTSRFQELVNADWHSAQSWKALTEAGAIPNHLACLLAFSCEFNDNPALVFVERIRSYAPGEARAVLKLAARLDLDCGALKQLDLE